MKQMESAYSRYVRYWWLARSQIDPTRFSGVYYHVFYDTWRRYIWVEKYDANYNLAGKYEFIWKHTQLIRTVAYSAAGEMKHYTTYQRNWYGRLLKMERHFPNGTTVPIDLEL